MVLRSRRLALLITSTAGLGAGVALTTLEELGLVGAIVLSTGETTELGGSGPGEPDVVGGDSGGEGQNGSGGDLHLCCP